MSVYSIAYARYFCYRVREIRNNDWSSHRQKSLQFSHHHFSRVFFWISFSSIFLHDSYEVHTWFSPSKRTASFAPRRLRAEETINAAFKAAMPDQGLSWVMAAWLEQRTQLSRTPLRLGNTQCVSRLKTVFQWEKDWKKFIQIIQIIFKSFKQFNILNLLNLFN